MSHALVTVMLHPDKVEELATTTSRRRFIVSNYPDGMTRADLIHVGEIEPDFEPETRVLRAVVFLTYVTESAGDAPIEEVLSPSHAEADISRALNHGGVRGLTYLPDEIEVVDAEYMSKEEADNYG